MNLWRNFRCEFDGDDFDGTKRTFEFKSAILGVLSISFWDLRALLQNTQIFPEILRVGSVSFEYFYFCLTRATFFYTNMTNIFKSIDICKKESKLKIQSGQKKFLKASSFVESSLDNVVPKSRQPITQLIYYQQQVNKSNNISNSTQNTCLNVITSYSFMKFLM